MSTTHDAPVLRADDVAKLLGVDRKTVYAAAERGEIPGTIRIGRLLRFSRAKVLAWMGQGAPSEE
jgi:excisionase family DNA binding protein